MKLSQSDYLETFGKTMQRLPPASEPPFDYWGYFDSIPSADFEQHDCSAGTVTYVWEHPNRRFQHVLVNSEDKNIFMVLVLDIDSQSVVGHRLLDLNQEYGLQRD